MRFRYNATFGDISDNIVEQLDLENMDISVGILFLAVLCAEIVLLPLGAVAISVGVLELETTLAVFTRPLA